MGNIVAIVGRPNVGKSTLFNRLLSERKAIVDDFSGVTRDRHYGKVEWGGRDFTLIDTGGYVSESEDLFEKSIREQVKIALDEADIVLFMVDAGEGIVQLDIDFAEILRRSKKPILMVVNKVDNHNRLMDSNEFYNLGFPDLLTIASISGSGTGDLLDEIVSRLGPDDSQMEDHSALPKLAVVGRPNVGKSSLINALLGVERNIVTDIAGTTRDSIHSHYNHFGKEFIIVDTAGVRRKSRVKEDIEFYSVMRSIKAIENCDVCVLVLDATLGFDSQDMNLIHLAVKNGRGVLILINKWDLVEKDTQTAKQFEIDIRAKLKPFDDIPMVFTSAINKQRIFKAVETALQVNENRMRRIPTHEFNTVLQEIIEAYPPPSLKGKFVKIKYGTQLPGYYPKFALFCNLPQYIGDSYKRYLENNIRKRYEFSGVPIQIFFRKK